MAMGPSHGGSTIGRLTAARDRPKSQATKERMSIRLRLTLLYGALVAMTVLASGALLYLAIDQTTINDIARAVTGEAAHLMLRPTHGPPRVALPPLDFAGQETYVQIATLRGTVISETANLLLYHQRLPLSSATLAALRRGQARLERVTVARQPLLLYSRPVADRPGTVLQVARLLQEYELLLARWRSVLTVGGGLAIVLGVGAGWLLAGTAIRPLIRIADAAEAISAAQGFARRIVYTGAPDELGRLVTAFNAMLERLQRAHEALRRFVDDAAHELRTPLTTMRGNLDLLQREPPLAEAEWRDVLADLITETERVSRLVDDLLTLASADAGRPLQQQRVPLAPLLDVLCRQAAVLAPDRTLVCHSEPDLAVLGDPDALKQVLLIFSAVRGIRMCPPTPRRRWDSITSCSWGRQHWSPWCAARWRPRGRTSTPRTGRGWGALWPPVTRTI
jgi:signal transduction histidine kinase